MVLTACGGSDNSSSTELSITPALGRFAAGTEVTIKDPSGTIITSGKVGSNGQAILRLPSEIQGPLLIEAGKDGDQYFDEGMEKVVTISGAGSTPVLRALLPSLADGAAGVAGGITVLI